MHDLTRTFELVRKAQNGDGAALESLFARYYERVRRSVRARIGPRLRRELETGDILQQTFGKAVEVFDRFDMRDEGSLIHWLSEIAERQIHDAADFHGAEKRDNRRRVALQARTPDGDTAPMGRELSSDWTAPIDKIARLESYERLETALDALSDGQREIIVLREFEGLSWDDVAREAGRPSPDAARMMHKQAMLALTKELSRVRPDA